MKKYITVFASVISFVLGGVTTLWFVKSNEIGSFNTYRKLDKSSILVTESESVAPKKIIDSKMNTETTQKVKQPNSNVLSIADIYKESKSSGVTLTTQLIKMLDAGELSENDIQRRNEKGISILDSIIRMKGHDAGLLFNKLAEMQFDLNFSSMLDYSVRHNPKNFEVLINLGLDPYSRNDDNTTLLNSALANGNYELAEYLSILGVKFEKFSINSEENSFDDTHTESVVYSLLQRGSSSNNKPETIKFLLEHNLYTSSEINEVVSNLYEVEIFKVDDRFKPLRDALSKQ
ncbi:ankyrin repeat domain-containing protein [Pseudoalteromonas lipolytica]|uniref:Ankyrin repeat domain-containing protein n=1 Tax=Pseudoalteromonas lipolytica TaxID=570156 RepID=A0ABU8SY99_9GAMM